MPTAATLVNGETVQFTGARAQVLYGNEATWATSPVAASRQLRLVAGETLDQGVQIYRSRQLRGDRMHNAPVRGSQDPGGSVPFELGPVGWNMFLWHLFLPSTVTVTGSADPYTQVFKAGTTGTPTPIGFTLEKGFLDAGTPVYEQIYGCKVDKMKLDFKVDAIPTGSFDLIAKQFATSSSSVFNNTPALPTGDPYSSVNIAIYEGSTNDPSVGAPTGNPLGLCTDLSLDISNAYYRKNGFILGSNLRQNLKSGTRMTTFTGKFMFQDLTLYNKAINGTNTSIKIVCADQAGTHFHIFDMPTCQFTPNGSSPKISSDGPLEISLSGEALPDSGINSDIQLTIITPEAVITN